MDEVFRNDSYTLYMALLTAYLNPLTQMHDTSINNCFTDFPLYTLWIWSQSWSSKSPKPVVSKLWPWGQMRHFPCFYMAFRALLKPAVSWCQRAGPGSEKFLTIMSGSTQMPDLQLARPLSVQLRVWASWSCSSTVQRFSERWRGLNIERWLTFSALYSEQTWEMSDQWSLLTWFSV